MNILQIKYFLTAALCQNFSQAAEVLYITQPALSRQISAIEKELNLQLFIRTNKAAHLTPAGECLYKEFQEVYKTFERAVAKAQGIQHGISGHLNIGILDGTVISDLFPRTLDMFTQMFPFIDILLHYYSFNALVSGLYDGSLDLVLTLFFDIKDRDSIYFRIIEKTHDHIAVHHSNPLASRDYIDLIDLKDETFIMVDRNDSEMSSKLIIDSCYKQGFSPKIKFSPSIQTSMLWVQAGVGVTMLDSRNMLRTYPEIKFLDVTQVSDPSLTAAWHQNNKNPTVPLIVEMLLSAARKS